MINPARRWGPVFPLIFFAITLFALAVGVLQQANPLLNFPSLDSGYYLYIGQQILQGKIPYLDLWESKPPGIFYINALGLWLGRGTRWGIWVLELAGLLVSTILGFVAMRRHYGFFPALFGSLAWLWGLQGVLQGGNLTEEYSLPVNFAAILFFSLVIQNPQRRLYPFLIGITFAASFLLRANNTGVQAAMVLAWTIFAAWERDFRPLFFRLLWSGLGVLTALGSMALFLYWQDNLGEMIEAALLFNLYLTGEKVGLLASLSTGVGFIGIPAGFALLGYLLLAALAPKRNLWTLFVLIALPLEIILSGLSGRGYPHYYITWMPVLALLSAFLLNSLPDLCATLDTRRVWVSLGTLVLVLLLLAAPLTGMAASLRQVVLERERGIELDDPVAAYLRKNTGPQDAVLVWGGRLVYNYLARRESPSSVLFYPLLVDSPISTRLAERFLADVRANPPAVIVDTHAVNQDLLPALDPQIRRGQEKTGKLWRSLPANVGVFYDFVNDNYEQETTLAGCTIYRLRTP